MQGVQSIYQSFRLRVQCLYTPLMCTVGKDGREEGCIGGDNGSVLPAGDPAAGGVAAERNSAVSLVMQRLASQPCCLSLHVLQPP